MKLKCRGGNKDDLRKCGCEYKVDADESFRERKHQKKLLTFSFRCLEIDEKKKGQRIPGHRMEEETFRI